MISTQFRLFLSSSKIWAVYDFSFKFLVLYKCDALYYSMLSFTFTCLNLKIFFNTKCICPNLSSNFQTKSGRWQYGSSLCFVRQRCVISNFVWAQMVCELSVLASLPSSVNKRTRCIRNKWNMFEPLNA